LANYDFALDIEVAKKTEKHVAGLFKRYYGYPTLKMNDTSDYDLLLKGRDKKVRLEVKEDFMVGDTGNLAIEFWSWDRPAGISVSMADFYLHICHLSDGMEYVLTETTELVRLIREQQYIRIVTGGDKNNSHMFLFKLSTILKVSKLIFN